MVSDCPAQAGGFQGPSVGTAPLVVVNPDNLLWQEETGVLVREEDGEYIEVQA